MKNRKPRVISPCNAERATRQPNARIIEFASDNGGGLIEFRTGNDDTLMVHVYRCDDTVRVSAPLTGPVKTLLDDALSALESASSFMAGFADDDEQDEPIGDDCDAIANVIERLAFMGAKCDPVRDAAPELLDLIRVASQADSLDIEVRTAWWERRKAILAAVKQEG